MSIPVPGRTADRSVRPTAILAGVGAIALVLLAASSALAASAPPLPPARLELAANGVGSSGSITLQALLQEANGRPIADASVAFFVVTTEFGPAGELVPLGSASTGSGGAAELAFTPTWTGREQFVARYAGSAQVGAAQASTLADVGTAHAAQQAPTPEPLDGAGQATVIGIGIAVVAVWLLLAAQVLRVWRIRGRP